jgi:hypothetical protein
VVLDILNLNQNLCKLWASQFTTHNSTITIVLKPSSPAIFKVYITNINKESTIGK